MAQYRQLWRTSTANDSVVFSICPGTYFGTDITQLELMIDWGDGGAPQSISSTDPTKAVEIAHTYTTAGDHKIYVTGGWTTDVYKTRSTFDRNRLLAYPIEADRTGGETPHKLIRWIDFRRAEGSFSTRIDKWKLDSNGDPLTDPATGQPYKGAEIVFTQEFYLAGRGSFKDYNNLQNWPLFMSPIFSEDPNTLTQASGGVPWDKTPSSTATINMDECFMNCSSLVGRNLWSIRMWGHQDINKITSAARCFKNAIASVVTDYHWEFKNVGRVTTQTSSIDPSTGQEIITTIVVNPGSNKFVPVGGTSSTRPVFGVRSWGMGNCVDMSEMFMNCGAKYIDLSGWDVSSCTDMTRMFANTQPERINLGRNGRLGEQWNVSNVTTMEGMFQNCKLETLVILNLGNYNHPPNFVQNQPITDRTKDIGIFDVGQVTNFDDMFRDSNVDSNMTLWDVNAALTFDGFSTNSTIPTNHLPDFTFPHADIEIVDFTGDKDDQYVTVSLEHTDTWSWSVNDHPLNNEPVNVTTVKLDNMQYGLNTLGLSAFDEEGNLDDEEFNYVLALTAVETQIDNTSCPAVIVEDITTTGQNVDLQVSLHNATSWQYSVPGTNYQEVQVSSLTTTIVGLPLGSNTILLSALDAAGEYLSDTKTVVVLGTGVPGGTPPGGTPGGGTGGGGTPAAGEFNPDPKPADSPVLASADLGAASVHTFAQVGSQHVQQTLDLQLYEVDQIHAFVALQQQDLSDETVTLHDLVPLDKQYNVDSVSVRTHVSDHAGTTGSKTLEQSLGTTFDQFNIDQIHAMVFVDDHDGNTGSLSFDQAVGVVSEMFDVDQIHTRVVTRGDLDAPVPWPHNTIWGSTQPHDLTYTEYESQIVPKIESYLRTL